MITDAVIQKPVFEKVADSKLSNDTTKWNDDIMQKFFEEVDYLPPNIGTDIVLSNVDVNSGYGKGSIVAWFKDKKINFPVIIKDFQLKPFDVFVTEKDGEQVYLPANFENIRRLVSSERVGTLENIWDKGRGQIQQIKTPGGVYPKQLIAVGEQPMDLTYPPFSKMSGWRDKAHKADLEKFAEMVERDPAVKANYIDNSGDLITNVIDLAHSKKETIADTNKQGDVDLNGLVNAKRAITTIDAEMFDVNQLQPVSPPAVCELRVYEYPSMEDFIESGENMSDRFMASRNGRPIVGIVMDMKENTDCDCPIAASSSDPKKALRQQRDQIFVSIDGSCFSTFNDYDKTGVGFYGSKVIQNGVEKVLKIIANNTSDDFISNNTQNRGDGADKSFNPINTMDQGQKDFNQVYPGNSDYNSKLIVVYGAGDAFECTVFRGRYRKISVNGSTVYADNEKAIIPANVASVQRVRSVENPVYKLATMGAKNIYLIPETSIIFNTEYMREYRKDDFLRPSLPIQKTFEDANITKVSLWVDAEGYRIEGKPYESLKKISGDKSLNTKEAITSLCVMGMTKEAATTALKHAINRSLSKEASVSIYGVRGDYINTSFNHKAGIEKTAREKEILKKIAAVLRKSLIKEASAITDPEAVDVVLSLNFINEDSLKGYIDNLPEMQRILSELSKMLVASRLGLSDLDESALMKSIQGLDEVIRGLENVKLAVK